MESSSVKKVVGLNVVKSSGEMEVFNPNKIRNECIEAGIPSWTAAEVSLAIANQVYNGISTKEIQRLVLEFLRIKDPDSAKRYERFHSMLVRTSKNLIEPFNREKIIISLIKEAGLQSDVAERIAKEVEETLRHLKLDFLTSPLIREMVSVKLLEYGLEEARTSYTRVGLPVFDVALLIEGNHPSFLKENTNLQLNPETIHKHMGDTVAKEFTLLKIPLKLADAHLKGLIHIHNLEFFMTRPFSQGHDLRFFLKNGLVGYNNSVTGPACHPEVAILHSVRELAIAQTNWSDEQSYDFFNIWLAPYVAGLKYEKIKQLAQMFIYEVNQMFVAKGQAAPSLIMLEPTVPKVIENILAVKPGGKNGPETYGNYAKEANQLFNAFIDVFLQGDYLGKPFALPVIEIKLTREHLSKFEEEYFKTAKLAAKFGMPYYLNLCPEYMYNITNSLYRRITAQDSGDENYRGYLRTGSLQVVTINLPRIAYEANGNDAKFFEILRERMNLAKEVLMFKREIIKERMKHGALPFCSMDIGGEYYLDLNEQTLDIGFVGLNEMLKAHIQQELHESQEAENFGQKVVKYMVDIKNEFIRQTGLRFELIQTTDESVSHRLALLDFKEFNGKTVVQGNKLSGSIYYTNFSHIRSSAPIPLSERIRIEASFHPHVQGKAILDLFFNESDPEKIWILTKKIATETLTARFTYTKDLTFCHKCNKMNSGLLEKCPNCGAENNNLEFYSRTSGYYQTLKQGWSSKKQELLDRYKYKI